MNQLSIIKNQIQVQNQKKPELARLEEAGKIGSFPMEERMSRSLILVSKLGSLLGLAQGRVDHLNSLIEFIATTQVHWTFEEIEKAFQLFVQGEFKEKPLQQLNGVVFGRVMTEFDEYKREKLRSYRREIQISREQSIVPGKEEQERILEAGVADLFKTYKATKTIPVGSSHLYRFLFDRGELPKLTTERREEIILKAKEIVRQEAQESLSGEINRSLRKEYKQELEKIEKGTSSVIDIVARRIVLAEYFDKKIQES